MATQTRSNYASFGAEQGWDLLGFATPEETNAAMKNGEADAVLADKSYLADVVGQDSELVFLEREELLGGGVGMGVRESDTELKAKFDAAIASMKADGSLNALITKWEIGDTF